MNLQRILCGGTLLVGAIFCAPSATASGVPILTLTEVNSTTLDYVWSTGEHGVVPNISGNNWSGNISGPTIQDGFGSSWTEPENAQNENFMLRDVKPEHIADMIHMLQLLGNPDAKVPAPKDGPWMLKMPHGYGLLGEGPTGYYIEPPPRQAAARPGNPMVTRSRSSMRTTPRAFLSCANRREKPNGPNATRSSLSSTRSILTVARPKRLRQLSC